MLGGNAILAKNAGVTLTANLSITRRGLSPAVFVRSRLWIERKALKKLHWQGR